MGGEAQEGWGKGEKKGKGRIEESEGDVKTARQRDVKSESHSDRETKRNDIHEVSRLKKKNRER